MADLRSFTLWARALLTTEAEELLLQVYGLESTGEFFPEKKLPALDRVGDARETRARLKKLFADEKDADIAAPEAYRKLVKEVAFTHLNRLVAFKLLEGRKLIRGTLDRYHDSNGFKIYLASHEQELKLYEQGTMPQDDLGEGPRDRAYRHFLLWQSSELAKEVRVLFDTDNLPSRLFPRSRVLHELIERFNAEEMREAWTSGNEETIGWVYQFFNAEEKDAAFQRVFKEKKKFQKDDLPAATQVFTPRWIVRFLVENSLGRLWVTMHPDSTLSSELGYLVPLSAQPPKPPLKLAREIQVLDPATGTMHFGLVAFDLMAKMYREEREHAGKVGWPTTPSVGSDDDIPAAILSNNLFGIDIDLRAVQLGALALYLRAKAMNRNCVLSESNLACADVAIFRGQHLSRIANEMALPGGVTRDLIQQFCMSVDDAALMGSLVQLERHFRNLVGKPLRTLVDEYVKEKAKLGEDESYFGSETSKGLRLLDVLARRYDAVFTNPPYMSSKNMNSRMSSFLARSYKHSKGDLYSSFIERCVEFLAENGRLAMITQQSFMFIPSYEELRAQLVNNTAIETMAHLGPRAFGEVQGEKVNTTTFVLRKESFGQSKRELSGVYFRLVGETTAEAKRLRFEQAMERLRRGDTDSCVYVYLQADFNTIPRKPWVYRMMPSVRQLFATLPLLGEIAKPRQGLATADNNRFVRYWWEVGLSRIDRGCASTKDSKNSSKRWFPYMKGGNFLRWYGNQEHCVNWWSDGAEIRCLGEESGKVASRPQNLEFYFKAGLTYTAVASKGFSVRLMPAGFVFDHGGNCLFPGGIAEQYLLLGLLNSDFSQYVLRMLNESINFYISDLERIPICREKSPNLETKVSRVTALAIKESTHDDRAFLFVCPADWRHGCSTTAQDHRDQSAMEREINQEIQRLYKISEDDQKAIDIELSANSDTLAESEVETETENDAEVEVESDGELELTRKQLASDWISYAVGVALGRCQPGVPGAYGCGQFEPDVAAELRGLSSQAGIMVLEEGHPDDLAQCVLNVLHLLYGDEEAEKIIRTATGSTEALRKSTELYLLGGFFKDHAKRYRKRPVYWPLQSANSGYSLYVFHERASADTLPLLQGKRYLGGQIHRIDSDLKLAKQKEGGASGGEKAIWSRRAHDLAELLEDLHDFDQRITAANNVQIKDRSGHPATGHWQPELDDGVLLNAAPLHDLAPTWKRADSKLDLKKAWKDLENGKYDWARTAMRYWPQRVLKVCKENKSFAIAHGLV